MLHGNVRIKGETVLLHVSPRPICPYFLFLLPFFILLSLSHTLSPPPSTLVHQFHSFCYHTLLHTKGPQKACRSAKMPNRGASPQLPPFYIQILASCYTPSSLPGGGGGGINGRGGFFWRRVWKDSVGVSSVKG
jgi:hypothetical protein